MTIYRSSIAIALFALAAPGVTAQQPCDSSPTSAIGNLASIFVGDVMRKEPHTQVVAVGSSRSSWPMVQLYFNVLYGWKSSPFQSHEDSASGTVMLEVRPQQDPGLLVSSRVLVYMSPAYMLETRIGDSSHHRLIPTGRLELAPCGMKRIYEAGAELRVLGEPEWRRAPQ